MIIIFCGIPGSGKTTIAETLAECLTAFGRVQMLSSDRIRAPVYRRFLKALEPNQRREDFLIFDATFYKKDWRQQIRAVAQGEKVITVYLHCPLEVALKRNKERRGKISERAVHIIFHQMELPKNPSIAIDTAATGVTDAVSRILALVRDATK